jgi:hypothetical protein
MDLGRWCKSWIHNSVEVAFSENSNYLHAEDVSPHSNKIIPVNFAKGHEQMISHLAALVNDEYIAIPKEHDKLIVGLKTGVVNNAIPKEHDKLIVGLKTGVVNKYRLDKELSSYNALTDALRLSLKYYNVN